MADSASESDSGSVDGGSLLMPPSPISRDQLQKRIESLSQHNRVLKVELDTYKLRVKGLQEENRSLKQASVNIQARAEQEEEYISNTLLKKIQALKKEKETLAINYEQEEECLTNDLSRRLNQLRHEKEHLEHTLEQEQECLVNKLMNKIQKLETETLTKQTTLEQLRREKVELENTLEQEQEALVNKLWKRMEKLEAEKRLLYVKLERPSDGEVTPPSTTNSSTSTGTGGGGSATTTASAVSHSNSVGNNSHSAGSAFANCNSGGGAVTTAPSSGGPGGRAPPPPGLLLAMGRARRLLDPSSSSPGSSCALVGGPATAGDLSLYIQQLRREVNGLKTQLHSAQREHTEKMVQYAKEEQHIRLENQRLQRRLTQEMERRDSLCRHLSESESSLEMDEERQAAELALTGGALGVSTAGIGGALGCRSRTVSSPGPFSLPSPGGSRPISPGRDMMMCGPPSPGVSRCYNCGAPQPPPRGRLSNHSLQQAPPSVQSAADKFVKPAAPSGIGIAMSPGRPMQMSPTPGRSSTPTEQVASPIGIPGSPMDTSRQ